MQKNDELILQISDISNDGSGIGKYEGVPVFVPQTAVGDTIRVKILKVKKSLAYGKALEIMQPSDDRIESDCGCFNKCGGCVFRHINYEAELKIKSLKVRECIKRIGGSEILPQPILYDKVAYYRNKAQYPVNLDGKAGFYAFHSHRIIPCSDCKLQPDIFNRIITLCEGWIKKYSVSVYDENCHKGLIRHIYLRIAEKTNEIMLALVINGDRIPYKEEFINLITQNIPNIKSIQLNINKDNTNVILGKKCITLFGSSYITDIICGIKIRISAMSFYQVNRVMAEKIYRKAAEYAKPENSVVLDLYCGAGTIGLSMADKAERIIGVEIVREAVEDARFNARQNGIENARFICGDASAAAKTLADEGIKPDVVIIDPPRKGLTEDLIRTIAEQFKPIRTVYVSCDPATLARDIKIFESYGYGLTEYTPADLFPRTSHVETVALLLNNKE